MAVAFAPALPARFTAAKPASRTLKSVRAVAPTRRVVVAKSHTVESGEWLSSIAAKYDVSITDLKAANAMEDYDVVFPGQVSRRPPCVALAHTASLAGRRPRAWPAAVRLCSIWGLCGRCGNAAAAC